MDKLTKKGLDGTQLKTIALVLMVLAVCGGRISAALPPGAGDAHCFDSRGICHHQPAAHVEQHYGRRLELFAGRCAAVCIAWTAQSAADGMGTGDFPV